MKYSMEKIKEGLRRAGRYKDYLKTGRKILKQYNREIYGAGRGHSLPASFMEGE